jgi:hypothetical protein
VIAHSSVGVPVRIYCFPAVARCAGPEEIGSMLYFNFTTPATTRYSNIVAMDPFPRSVANFESVLGQFFMPSQSPAS